MKAKTVLTGLLVASLFINGYFVTKWPWNAGQPITTNCPDYSKEAKSILPFPLVRDMVGQYNPDPRVIAVSKKLGDSTSSKYLPAIGDSKAIWFDLETLTKFCNQIKSASESLPLELRNKRCGVRIYYARYPEQKFWNRQKYFNALQGMDAAYALKHTLVMIPTIETDNDYHMDFNPMALGTNNDLFNLEGGFNEDIPIFGLTSFPSFSSNQINSQFLQAQNHGGLFPPKKNDGMAFKIVN